MRRSALLLMTAVASAAAGVDGQEIRWTGTTSYSRGSYVFDATTHTVSFASGLRLTWGPIDFGGSIPLLLQNSQLVSQVGGVPLPTGGGDYGAVGRRQPGETLGTRSGGSPGGGGGAGSQTEVTYRDEFAWEVGDPFLSAAGRLYEGNGFLRSLQANVSAKAPLRGLDSGVGTGEWDFGAGASAFTSLAGTYVFFDLTYWWYGDLPELELADGLSYGVGLSRPVFDAKGSLMVSYFGAEPLIESMDRPASLGFGASYSPRVGRSLSGGVAVGLSESSPDVSVYAGWSLRVR